MAFTFKGQVVTRSMGVDMPIFMNHLTFTKTHILTRGIEQIRPPRLQGENVPTNENYVMPHGAAYKVEFLGDTKNDAGRFDDIRITYTDYRTYECTAYILTDSDNHRRAKWMHKQTWFSQNWETILFSFISALMGFLFGLLTTSR